MTPFRRGKAGILSIYVPTGPGYKQRSTGTSDVTLAKRIERLVKELANEKEWELLRAVADQRRAGKHKLTLDLLWQFHQRRELPQLKALLRAKQIADFLEGFKADARHNAPATWDQNLSMIERTLDGLTFTHELTPGTLRDRLNALTSSPGTRRHYLYALSSFCRYLVAHGALSSNPLGDRDLVPRPAKANKRKVWKGEDVDRRICDRAAGAMRIAFVLCAASGADRSTVFALRVRDLQLLAPGIEPDAALGREHRVDIPGTKTATRDRRGVRLEPWAAPILREWTAGKLPETLLITGVSADLLSRTWKVHAQAAGAGDYWLRDTRHSYACRAFLAGYPLWEVSKWLGHASVAMTADVYLQFDYDVARKVREGTAQANKPTELQSTATATATRSRVASLRERTRRA